MMWNKPKGNPFTQSRIAHGYFLEIGSRTECLLAPQVPRLVLEVLSVVTNFKSQYKYPGKKCTQFYLFAVDKVDYPVNHVRGGRGDVLRGVLSSLNIFHDESYYCTYI